MFLWWGFADEGEEFFGGECHADFAAGHALLEVVEGFDFFSDVVGVGVEVERFFAGGAGEEAETAAGEVGVVLALAVVVFDPHFFGERVDDFFAVVAGALGNAGAVFE